MLAFAHPAFLLLLLVWPLLLVIRRAYQARVPRDAADFLLWERAARTLPAPAVRSRLSLRDFAWLLPLLFLTLAMAGPELVDEAAPVETTIILDRSASMGTVVDGRSRLERGMHEVEAMLARRPFRLEPVPAAPSTSSARLPSAASVALEDLRLRATLAQGAGHPVIVVTDLEVDGLPEGIGLIRVADDARNAGIVAAGCRQGAGLLVRVDADDGAGARSLRIVDAETGEVLHQEALADPRSKRFELPETLCRKTGIRIELTPADACTADDSVTLLAATEPIRVTIAGAGNPALERALRAHPGAVVRRGEDRDVELVVRAKGSKASLLLPPLSGESGFVTGPPHAAAGRGSGRGPWDGFDLAFDGLPAVHTLERQPPGTEVLLAVGPTPLLVRHGQTWLLLVDPETTGWPSLASFPLAIARIIEAVGASPSSLPIVRRAGEAVRVTSRGATRATWTEPGGVSFPIDADASGQFTIFPDQAGIGHLDAGVSVERIATGVLSRDETRAARRSTPLTRAPTWSDVRELRRPLTPYCAALALLAMLGLVTWLYRPGTKRSGLEPAALPTA